MRAGSQCQRQLKGQWRASTVVEEEEEEEADGYCLCPKMELPLENLKWRRERK